MIHLTGRGTGWDGRSARGSNCAHGWVEEGRLARLEEHQELYFSRRHERISPCLVQHRCIAQSVRAYCSLTYAEFVWALWLTRSSRCDAKLTQFEAFRPAVMVTMSHRA